MASGPVPTAGETGEREPAAEGRRLLVLIVPIAATGLAATVAAAWSLAASAPSAVMLGGLVLMLGGAVLAEAYPVEIESLPAGNVSLAAVFVVSAGLIYGWPAAVLVALATRAALELVQRRPPIKLVANGAVYALSGLAAGLAERLMPDRTEIGALFGAVLLGATAFYALNVLLIALIISRVTGEPFRRAVVRMAYWTAIPFAIMASVSLILYVLWERSPLAAVALFGPLGAIVLYQRSVYRTLRATRLALTDELTGLGNQRHFHERIEADLDHAVAAETPLTLCLLDLDDFKRINDTFGHPVGDQVLTEVASHLRQGGEAFRLGGDEFAIVLPGQTERDGMTVARAVAERIHRVVCPDGSRVSVSAGVACFPTNGMQRNELQRLADAALYRAKREGKDLVRAHRPGVVELDSRRDDRACLAARLAARLGIPESDVAAALAAETINERVRAAL
jgi:diguanylate cyclase (GGDEF)-like protein